MGKEGGAMSRAGKTLCVLILMVVAVVAFTMLRGRGIGEAVDNVADQVTGAAAMRHGDETRARINKIADQREEQLRDHIGK